MESVSYVFGIAGFIFGLAALAKVKKLEKTLKESGVIADNLDEKDSFL